MRTVAFCEIEPYCQAVLRRHWPDVPVFDDVRTLKAADVSNSTQQQMGTSGQSRIDRGMVDVICGGFPCQDISVAGNGEGITGSRSGLWKEFARIIGEVRPRYVVVENVSALLGRGLSDVLGDLAALGFDAEWHCIPASAVGAPHRRDRIWVVAYSGSSRCLRHWSNFSKTGQPQSRIGLAWGSNLQPVGQFSEQWRTEPDMGRVAHGVPNRVDRLKALGNAIVPQIAEIIGKAIMSHDKSIS
jgi:DNA (cytosine-5)-methyltransferase 1